MSRLPWARTASPAIWHRLSRLILDSHRQSQSPRSVLKEVTVLQYTVSGRQGRQKEKGTFLLGVHHHADTRQGVFLSHVHSTRTRRIRQDKECSWVLSILQGQGGQGKTRSVPESWTRCPFYKDKEDKARQGVFLSLGQGVHSTRTRRTRQDKECSWVLDKVSILQGQDKTRSVPESWTRYPVDKDKKDKARQGVFLSLGQGVHPTRTRQDKECSWVLYKLFSRQGQEGPNQNNQRDSYPGWQALEMEDIP